ncbi:hypothetical protein BU15DRAFT_70686 [Melanogaster broomeanus]|nr:hypothetical protein BU15DRAFT_70686 [Melanogaster broomeanus]
MPTRPVHLQKIITERRAGDDGQRPADRSNVVFARPKASDLNYISKTMLSIDAYFGVCKIDAEQFEEAKLAIRNLTLLYLKEDVPIDKQNESNVNSLIQHVAELHEWLSTYEGCWPARVYLNRYWRTRLVHRRSASDRVVKGAPRTRRERLANREEVVARNLRATPAQKRVYPLRRQMQQRRSASASASGDDDKSDSATSSSDSEIPSASCVVDSSRRRRCATKFALTRDRFPPHCRSLSETGLGTPEITRQTIECRH